MTVGKLAAALKNMPQEAKVVVYRGVQQVWWEVGAVETKPLDNSHSPFHTEECVLLVRAEKSESYKPIRK
jgi:hypothetical protein